MGGEKTDLVEQRTDRAEETGWRAPSDGEEEEFSSESERRLRRWQIEGEP